MQNCTW